MTVAERPTTAVEGPLHRRLGLTNDELAAVRDRLGGREPNALELAMFSVMWSEHCSYKSSKPLLRTLPTGSSREGVVAGPGENAGVISIGDGLAVAFKIESHNHPSAVEPTQGAATGVGGILRDIFTMGARPIAVLDALRFGDPSDDRTRHLVDGVVKGVGGYGNCVGVPTVGGLVAGLQDLGAGGITCATSETADRAGTGMRIELAAIQRRELGMEPFEVMISESQERMLAVVEPSRWDAVRAVCERWGLPVAVIGRV